MGRLVDPGTGRQRDCQALIFTPVVSRYSFVWLTHRQTIDDVIAGFEAAWVFYGGVFATVIVENVPRNIFGVLCPVRLCGRGDRSRVTTAVNAPAAAISGT
jgi:hypothetical protein